MRYAIITDIHANYTALRAVDNDVRRLRAVSDEPIDYWFLGDLVGYGPQPVECVRWLRYTSRVGARWVAGNHDEWFILPDGKVHPDALASLSRHQALLNEPENQELGTWFCDEVRSTTQAAINGEEPRSLVAESWDGLTALFVHGSAVLGMRRGTYLYPWDTMTLVDEFQRLAKRDKQADETLVLFCGHTHYPMWARYTPTGDVRLQSIKYRQSTPLGEGLMIISPGSVGQPRDGDPRAAYLLFNPQAKTVEFRRVEYEIEETVAALESDDHYPPSLAARLRSANGGLNGQEFARVYQRPEWDLEAME